MSTLAFSRSESSSVSSTSSPQQPRRVTKRFNRALFDEVDLPTKESRVTFATPDIAKEEPQARRAHAETTRLNQLEEIDDSFGFSCGARLNEFGCGGGTGVSRSKKREKEDPHGVVGRVRTMIKEKFSSRIDFSPSECRPNVTFVEHRM